jgi:outer membrane protein TolC
VAGVARAEGRSRQALAALLPTARAQGGVGYDVLNPQSPALGVVGAGGAAGAAAQGKLGTPTVPVVGVGVSANVPIVDLASWSGWGSANAAYDAAVFSEGDVRRRLVQSLSRLVVSVVAAERAAELNRTGLRLALERAALATRTQQLGASTLLDTVRVQQDVEVARAAVLAGDEQLFRARESLGELLGSNTQEGVAANFDVHGLTDDVRTSCTDVHSADGSDGDARDDVRSARAQAESARKSQAQTLWGYAPRLDVVSNAAALTTRPGPVALGTWSIGAVVSLPLWEGGVREGQVTEREAIAVQAEEAATASERSAHVDLERARRAEGTARALFETAKTSRELAERADQLTRRSFEMGRVGSLDLVQSAAVLRQAELALAAREFEWAQARLDSFLAGARCSS